MGEAIDGWLEYNLPFHGSSQRFQMKPKVLTAALLIGLSITFGCQPTDQGSKIQQAIEEQDAKKLQQQQQKPDLPDPPGMVWIPGGQFVMGGQTSQARANEGPPHVVELDGFYMDTHEVTNQKFAEFVKATGYVTTAETAPELAEVEAQRPPGLPPIDPSILVPGSLVFQMTSQPVSTLQPGDFSQWWRWTPGANWRKPAGPESSVENLVQHPVVHVSWDDCVAYCQWAGKRLPTEAEWEYAARGGLNQKPYVWGDQPASDKQPQSNIWQGQFPNKNDVTDGYETTAPVGSFSPNPYGLYDMAGNVWEWCHDWYRDDAYQGLAQSISKNPQGPSASDHPFEPRKVKRGGSFLCHRDYCSSYRPSARQSTSLDTGLSHSGFRAVMTADAWRKKLAESSQ